MLESLLHESNLFVTLTYAPEYLPADGSLQPRHVQLWLKRLRKRLEYKIRFFAVGEYGDINWRPHYHVLLFGCFHPKEVAESWDLGHTMIGTVTPASVQYCTGYCTKGMTRSSDPKLKGRHPEFARMSLRRGMGYGACGEIARVVKDQSGELDIPFSVRMNGKKMPLGRYLRSKARLQLSGTEKVPEYLKMLVAVRFQELMRDPSEREKREQKRAQAKAIAKWYDQFHRSKKGLGI